MYFTTVNHGRTSLFVLLQIVAFALIIPHTLPKVQSNIICYITLPTVVMVRALLLVLALISNLLATYPCLFVFTMGIREGWGITPIMVSLMRQLTELVGGH